MNKYNPRAMVQRDPFLFCSICQRENQKVFRSDNNVSGLVKMVEHWKAIHPGRVVCSNGKPVEEMPMDWSK